MISIRRTHDEMNPIGEADVDEISILDDECVHIERMDDDSFCLTADRLTAYIVVKRRWFRRPLIWINVCEEPMRVPPPVTDDFGSARPLSGDLYGPGGHTWEDSTEDEEPRST